MKKLIKVVSGLEIVAATVLLSVLVSGTIVKSSEKLTTQKFQDFPKNKSQLIDFQTDQDSLNRLSQREKEEQLRDWLLLTIASDKSLSADELNKSLYDVSPVRYDYMKPVSNFENGQTRSLYIGDGTLIALLPNNISSEQRIDYLAHIADKHRQNLGEKPISIQVFEYEIETNKQYASLTRKEELNAGKIFTDKKYGYYEAEIKTEQDLENFLQQVDDITFSQTNYSSLTLGGRKIQSHDYQRINVEDIAAIWQSEKHIQEKFNRWNEDWQAKFNALPSGVNQAELSRLKEERKKEAEELKLVNGSGFSLDPGYDYQGLSETLEREKPWLQSLKLKNKPVITDLDIQQVERGLSQKDIVPYRQLIDKVEHFFQSNPEIKMFAEKEVFAELEPYINTQKNEFNNEVNRYQKQLENEIQAEIAVLKNSGQLSEEAQPKLDQIIAQKESDFRQFKEKLIEVKEKEIDNKFQEKIKQKLAKLDYFLQLDLKHGFQSARYDGDLKGTEVGMTLFYTDLLAKLWALDYLGTIPQKDISDFKPLTEISSQVSPIYQQELKELTSTRLWFGSQDKGFQVANNGKNLLFARNSTRIYAASSNPLNHGKETTAAADSEAFLGWWNEHYEEVARYEPQYEKLNEIMKWSLLIGWLNQSNQGDLLGFLDGVDVKHDNWFPDWAKANASQLKFQQWDKQTCQDRAEINLQKPVCFYPKNYKGSDTETMPLLTSKSFIQFGGNGYIYGGVSLANQETFSKRIPVSKSSSIDENSLRGNIDYDSVKPNSFKTIEETTYSLKTENPSVASSIAKAKDGTKLRNPESELANLEITRQVARTNDGIEINAKAGDTDLGSFQANKTANGFVAGFLSRDLDLGQSLALDLSLSGKTPKEFLLSDRRVKSILKDPNKSLYYVEMTDSKSWLQLESGGGGNRDIPPNWSSRVGSPKEPENLGGYSGDSDRNYLLAWRDKKKVKKLHDEGKLESIRYDSSRQPSPDEEILIDNLEDGNYEAVAQKLIEDPQGFNKFQKKYFKEKLEDIDRLLQNKNYAMAALQIDNLIRIHGRKPDLMIRKIVVDIKRERLNVEDVNPNQANKGISESNNKFFDEINGLLGRTNNKSKFNAIKKDDAFIYIEDNPVLNNIDWNQPIEASIPHIPTKTKVYRLQNGEIELVQASVGGSGAGSGSAGVKGVKDNNSSSNFSNDYQSNKNRVYSGSFTNLIFINRLNNQCQEQEQNDQCPSATQENQKNNKEQNIYIIFVPEEAKQI